MYNLSMGGAGTHAQVTRDGPSDLHTFRLPARTAAGALVDPITIRLADQQGERNRASMLIRRRYDRRGMGANHGLPCVSNCVSFTAATGPAETVGTLSLTVDSADGLQTDKTYRDELDKFRARDGSRLCELTKLAFDLNGNSLPVLASLFHIIFIYGTRRFACTDLVIEVVPRHRRFYEAMLNFQCIGEARLNPLVGKETNLLWLKVADIRHYIDMHAGRPGGRSLYPHFFSPQEELGIYHRLTRMVPDDAGQPAFAPAAFAEPAPSRLAVA